MSALKWTEYISARGYDSIGRSNNRLVMAPIWLTTIRDHRHCSATARRHYQTTPRRQNEMYLHRGGFPRVPFRPVSGRRLLTRRPGSGLPAGQYYQAACGAETELHCCCAWSSCMHNRQRQRSARHTRSHLRSLDTRNCAICDRVLTKAGSCSY